MAISNQISEGEIAERNKIIQSFISDPDKYYQWWVNEGIKIADIVISKIINRRMKFHEREDLLQDICIRLFYYIQGKQRKFPGKMSTICWWVSRSEVVAFLKGRKARGRDLVLSNIEYNIFTRFKAREINNEYPEKPECLNQDEYNLLIRYVLDGETLKTLSKELGITKQGVHEKIKVILARCRNELLWETEPTGK